MKEIKITKGELRQIYYINREILMWQKELDKLRHASLIKSPMLSNMPKGGRHRGMEDLAVDIAEYETIIAGLLVKVQLQRKKIMGFINEIEDSMIKQIIFYRDISCMTWNEVANLVGGGNTENSVKQAYSRFVKGLN